jgi:butyrate kinase
VNILAINPGSTSTKIGIYKVEGDELKPVAKESISHSTEELKQFDDINDQIDYRADLIKQAVTNAGLTLADIDSFVGRGGLVRSLESGVYEVNDQLIHDLKVGVQGKHAANLAGQIAHALAQNQGKVAYIADPEVTDELAPVARISGHPKLERRSLFHALNQKAIARRYAKEQGKRYGQVNVIVAHMGGGVSVGAHQKGRVIDVNDALDGDGPFSPERAGNVPSGQLVDLCFSGDHSHAEVKAMLVPQGGYVAYFGTNNAQQIGEEAQTDPEKALVQDAMAYQVAKYIGAMAAALEGEVDAILLTGGIVHSETIVHAIKKRVGFIAPVIVYPGEDELLALASAAQRVLAGEEKVKEY